VSTGYVSLSGARQDDNLEPVSTKRTPITTTVQQGTAVSPARISRQSAATTGAQPSFAKPRRSSSAPARKPGAAATPAISAKGRAHPLKSSMNDQRVSAKADQATSGASSKRMEGHASSDVPVSAAAARSDGGTGLKVRASSAGDIKRRSVIDRLFAGAHA